MGKTKAVLKEEARIRWWEARLREHALRAVRDSDGVRVRARRAVTKRLQVDPNVLELTEEAREDLFVRARSMVDRVQREARGRDRRGYTARDDFERQWVFGQEPYRYDHGLRGFQGESDRLKAFYHWTGSKPKPATPQYGNCVVCRRRFQQKPKGPNRKTCGARCRKRLQRGRERYSPD